MAPAVDVCKVVALVHGLIGQHDVIGIAGIGIYGDKAAHASDLEIGIDLMSLFDHQGRSHQFMVGCLIEGLFGIVEL